VVSGEDHAPFGEVLHRRLAESVLERSGRLRTRSGSITFWPTPTTMLQDGPEPFAVVVRQVLGEELLQLDAIHRVIGHRRRAEWTKGEGANGGTRFILRNGMAETSTPTQASWWIEVRRDEEENPMVDVLGSRPHE
jgi:hypothetical protein